MIWLGSGVLVTGSSVSIVGARLGVRVNVGVGVTRVGVNVGVGLNSGVSVMVGVGERGMFGVAVAVASTRGITGVAWLSPNGSQRVGVAVGLSIRLMSSTYPTDAWQAGSR